MLRMSKKVKVIKTRRYEKCFDKLDNDLKEKVAKQEKLLIKSGGRGKPLSKNLFERKIENYRIYYSRKSNGILVLLFISIHKKTSKTKQQREIDRIKLLKFNALLL